MDINGAVNVCQTRAIRQTWHGVVSSPVSLAGHLNQQLGHLYMKGPIQLVQTERPVGGLKERRCTL